MFIVKLIVTALCFLITKMYCVNYCDVCINHTLCKFNGTAPGPSCEDYDMSVNLTNYDINNIVQKINERRHFVASGLTRNYRLPQAANMRKIVWSNELSKSAQRWADQCDINQHPDKEDECRNLETEKVGQCIASITGVTRGLNVRSFIDYWFMKSLTYIGSISFYNYSTDYSSRQFTQLIWANTHSVGCGRVKFYINNGRVPIDRLVCNFAPSGNINEETVYAIGFPATQCPKDTVSDSTYTSLCGLTNTIELPTRNNIIEENASTVDNKYFQGILKLKEIIRNETGGNKRQKIRHIWKNESSGKRDYFLDYEFTSHQPPIKDPVLFNKKVYHQIKPMSTTMNQQPIPLRRFSFNKCTRRACKSPTYQALAGCTRKVKPQINNEYFPRSTTTEMTYKKPISNIPSHHFRCTRGKTTTPTICTCDLPTKCQCTLTEILPTSKCQGTPCGNILREDRKVFFRKFKSPSNSHYDTNDNNNNIRNNFNPMLIDIPRRNYRNLRKNPFSPQRKYPKRLYQNERKRRQYDIKPPWQEDIIGKKRTLRGIRYTTLGKRKNKKPATTRSIHKTEAITIKLPSEIKRNKGRPNNRVKEKYLSFDELVSLRKKNKQPQNARRDGIAAAASDAKVKNKIEKVETEKEAADIIENDAEVSDKLQDEKGAPEEAEAPHAADNDNNDRKKDAAPAEHHHEKAATPASTTSKYSKINFCTRKMTCTWTMPTHAGDGNMANRPIGLNGVTRTRLGYVEGCSRTSTCTRDYMDRNRVPNSGDGGAGGAGGEGGTNGGKDEDYCEKRSLKVQRRNSENNHDYKLDNYNDEESRTTPAMRELNDDYRCICT